MDERYTITETIEELVVVDHVEHMVVIRDAAIGGRAVLRQMVAFANAGARLPDSASGEQGK